VISVTALTDAAEQSRLVLDQQDRLAAPAGVIAGGGEARGWRALGLRADPGSTLTQSNDTNTMC
jgi:hypothetical protein